MSKPSKPSSETSRTAYKPYQPKTGAKCGCRPGVQRDNCGTCEGTGWVIDFAAIRARREGTEPMPKLEPIKRMPVTEWRIVGEVAGGFKPTMDVLADDEVIALITAARAIRDEEVGSIYSLTVVARRVAGGPWIEMAPDMAMIEHHRAIEVAKDRADAQAKARTAKAVTK